LGPGAPNRPVRKWNKFSDAVTVGSLKSLVRPRLFSTPTTHYGFNLTTPAMGPERSRLAFANNGRDATHHNAYGAYLLAWAVADRLRELDDPIAAHISTAKPRLDLARPPSLEDVQLQLPPSPPTEAPAGS